MGRQGTAKDSATTQFAKGETRPSRVNYNEPDVEIAKDREAPPDLAGEARIEWDALIDFVCEHGYVTDGDLSAFGDYCRSVGRLREIEALYAVSTAEQRAKQNLYVLVHKFTDQANKMRRECGLTPTTRGAVRAARGAVKKSAEKKGAAYVAMLKAV